MPARPVLLEELRGAMSDSPTPIKEEVRLTTLSHGAG